MTRVNTEQLKYTPWFAKAGAACSIIPIARFINDRIFTLKGGGYASRLLPWLECHDLHLPRPLTFLPGLRIVSTWET